MKTQIFSLCSGGLLLLTLAGCTDVNDPMIMRHRALLAEQKGHYEQAIQIRNDFIKASPDYYWLGEVHFEQGMTHLDRGEYPQALEHFNAAIEDDPGFRQAYIRRCQVNSILGNHEQALADGRRALELSESDRNLSVALLYRGDSQAQLNNPHRALASWHLALVFDPEQIPALRRLFDNYMEAGQFAEALQLMEDSLAQNDRMAVKQLLYSQVLTQLDRRDEAVAALARAKELNVGNALEIPDNIDEFIKVEQIEAPPLLHSTAQFPAAASMVTEGTDAVEVADNGKENAAETVELPVLVAEEPAEEVAPEPEVIPVPAKQITAVEVARQFLASHGITIVSETISEHAKNPVLTCKEQDKSFELLIKATPLAQKGKLSLSQQELTDITSQDPPRGMLVISDQQTEESPQTSRVAAFSRCWRPDPTRLTAVQYEYQIPTVNHP